jgi:hypothetical protein
MLLLRINNNDDVDDQYFITRTAEAIRFVRTDCYTLDECFTIVKLCRMMSSEELCDRIIIRLALSFAWSVDDTLDFNFDACAPRYFCAIYEYRVARAFFSGVHCMNECMLV